MICHYDAKVPVVSDAACEASSSTEVTVGQCTDEPDLVEIFFGFVYR